MDAAENPAAAPPPRQAVRWGVIALVLVGVVAFFTLINIMQAPHPPAPMLEAGALNTLHQLLASQERYKQKNGVYARAGQALAAAQLDPPNEAVAAAAWEQLNGNGDAATPQPDRHGYVYRMLQGRGADKQAFAKEGTPPGAWHWAATARAEQTRSSHGRRQFFIDESGRIYRHEEPAEGTPGYNQFLLDALPDAYQTDTGWDLAKLEALGWTVVR